MPEPPNKKRRRQDKSDDANDPAIDEFEAFLEKQAAQRIGNPIVKTNAKPPDPRWRDANVTMDDTTRYIPQGFRETAQGYDEFIHVAADISQHQYRASTGKTSATQIGEYTRAVYTEGTNNPYYAVWVNEADQHAFVVYKGTNKNVEWINQNFDIFVGNEGGNPYFADAYRYYKEVVEELGPNFTVDVTGHSLGGAKAMYVTRMAEKDAASGLLAKAPHSITFNPGTGPWTTFPSRENNLVIRNADDPISFLPSDTVNTVTYKNYETIDAIYNFENRLKQHRIRDMTSEFADKDGGSLVNAATGAGLPDKPVPGFDEPVRDGVGGDVVDLGGDVVDIGEIGEVGGIGIEDVIGGAEIDGMAGRVAEEAAAKGLAALQAEIAESVVMSEFDMLLMFDLTGQGMVGGGGLGDYVASSQAWDASGYGDVKDLNHYTPYIYDKAFEKFEPKAAAERARRGVIQQIHDFYQHPLQYNEHLFKDRADYKKYQTDFILNSLPEAAKGAFVLPDGQKPLPNWAMSFNRVLKGYAKEQARDEKEMKWYLENYRDPGDYSSSFLGTSLSVQKMGLLLAQQAQIVQRELGYQDGGTADMFDRDGMKAVLSAVARQEYIDKAPKSWYKDRPTIPSYSESYDTMVKRRKEEYIKHMPSLQKILDDYEQNGIIPHAFGPDYPERPPWEQVYKEWDAHPPTLEQRRNMTPYEDRHYREYLMKKQAEKDKERDDYGKNPPNWYEHPYGENREPVAPTPSTRPESSESDKNSASNNNKPPMHHPHNPIRIPDSAFDDNGGNNYLPRPALPGGLNPANGGQGHPDTSAPNVPTRDQHNLHPGQPGYVPGDTRDGLPDGENRDPNETHDGVTHDERDHDEEYMNHDVNNHMQAPSEGMSTSQYTQALSRFTNNAFGNLGTMKSKGMNFTRFAELSDINGSMAEHARDMLAD